MFGFGDEVNPHEASLDLLEVYTEEFVSNLVARAAKRSHRVGSNTLKLADILKVIEKDEKKFLRMPYLLAAQKETNRTLQVVKNHMDYVGEDTRKTLNFNKMM